MLNLWVGIKREPVAAATMSPASRSSAKYGRSLRNADFSAHCSRAYIDSVGRRHDFEGFRIDRRQVEAGTE
jgi:hypothetical protein